MFVAKNDKTISRHNEMTARAHVDDTRCLRAPDNVSAGQDIRRGIQSEIADDVVRTKRTHKLQNHCRLE